MLSKKAMAIKPSITLGTVSKVKELISQGKNVINLSIGEPDFLTTEDVKEAAINAIHNNKTKYDIASGNLELRQSICKDLKSRLNLEYKPSNIVVSSGAKHAITNALTAILDPGDEVLIPSPYWVSYPSMVNLCGGVGVFVKSKKEDGFLLNIEAVKNAITNKTKAVIINNPSNPTGNIYSKKELFELCSFLADKGIIIIADEIYEQIVFDIEFTSIASLSENIKSHTIVINGLSKSSAMTGWRIGYTAAPETISKAIASIQSHLVSHPSTISQAAAIKAINDGQDAIKDRLKVYKSRRDYIVDFFKKWGKLDIIPPKGAFYVFIDISPLRKYFKDEYVSLRIADDLITKKFVAVVPGIGFGEDDFIRMSYATSLEQIKLGLEKIKEYCEEILNEN